MDITTKKLTDKQTALVDTLVATGCSITEAAHAAGYAKGDSRESDSQQGFEAATRTTIHDAEGERRR